VRASLHAVREKGRESSFGAGCQRRRRLVSLSRELHLQEHALVSHVRDTYSDERASHLSTALQILARMYKSAAPHVLGGDGACSNNRQ
jgi:hypothetical protein